MLGSAALCSAHPEPDWAACLRLQYADPLTARRGAAAILQRLSLTHLRGLVTWLNSSTGRLRLLDQAVCYPNGWQRCLEAALGWRLSRSAAIRHARSTSATRSAFATRSESQPASPPAGGCRTGRGGGTAVRANRGPDVDGILLQLPLPEHLNARALIDLIAPVKDVDGLRASDAGRLVTGQRDMVPCTPLGVIMLLRSQFPDLPGKICTVIGCSPLVRRPMMRLLLRADCTVSVAHRHTRDIATLCRNADIVIVAAGMPRLVKAD